MKRIKLTDKDIEFIYNRHILATGLVIIAFSIVTFVVSFYVGKLLAFITLN